MTTDTETYSDIQVWIGCLSAYNNAKLHGRYIDATQGVDHIWDEVNAMLAESPEEDSEEWFIADYDGFYGIQLSEYESFEHIAELAEFVIEYGELGAELYQYLGEDDVETVVKYLEDNYHGEYDSERDYAEQFVDDCYSIPPEFEWLAQYIDYESMARDMFCCDYFSLNVNGSVHVFHHA